MLKNILKPFLIETVVSFKSDHSKLGKSSTIVLALSINELLSSEVQIPLTEWVT